MPFGPLQPLATTSKCCGAARQSGHSLQLQNLRGANSQTADKAPFRCKCEKQNATMLASARRAENGVSRQPLGDHKHDIRS